MNTTIKILMYSCYMALFGSCNSDDPIVSIPQKEGNILISTMLPNPDGMSGAAYMQLIENLDEAQLTNSAAIPIPFSSVPNICGEDVFIVPGWGAETDVMSKYTRVDGALVKQGSYTLPENSGATHVITKGDLAYVSCAMSGQILVLDHQRMELVAAIDIRAYGVGDENPDPSVMLIRDNYLFVPLTQMVGGYFPAPERPYADVLIIDLNTNEVVKMITEKTSGISCPSRPIDPNSIFMDENKDIYILGLGAWGAVAGHQAGILRIKAGQTEFDENYQFVFNTTSIEGESNHLDYIHAVCYHGKGKLYGTANIPAYYSNPPNFIEDRTVVPVEIDLEAQTIKKLDFPYSNSYGVSVGMYKKHLVFGLATTGNNGFYTYDNVREECSKQAIITTEGYPYTFNAFGN